MRESEPLRVRISLKQRQCVNWRQENTVQAGTMEGGDGSLYPPPSGHPGILSPACWAVSHHPWRPGFHLRLAHLTPYPPWTSLVLGGGCTYHRPSFLPSAPTGRGPGPRCAADSLGGLLWLLQGWASGPSPCPGLPGDSPTRLRFSLPGAVMFLLIPPSARTTPLPQARAQPGVFTSRPHTHTPKNSSPFPSHNQIQM